MNPTPAPREIDALFISHFETLGVWHDDLTPEEADPLPASEGSYRPGSIDDAVLAARRARLSPRIDDGSYDGSRFLSWVRYGHTREYRRYDQYTPTHLVGPYYQSFLGRRGYRLMHVNHASRLDLPLLAQRYQPRYLLLSSTLTPVVSLADAVRRLHQLWPDVPVVVGGLQLVEFEKHAPEEAFRYLLKQINADAYVVSPRGEEPLLEILAHDPRALAGLRPPSTWIRHGDGYHKEGTVVERGLSLDDTWVRWSAINPDDLYHIVHMRTARGCPFRCTFCSYPVNQGTYVAAKAETIEAELSELASLGVARSIIFTDDTFNVPAARFEQICRVLSRFDFRWHCYLRVQFLTPARAAMMRDAGCGSVLLGLESLDDQVLKNMNKHATRAAYVKGLAALRGAGIPSHASFILGFPGDKRENALEIPGFCDDQGIDFFTAEPWGCSPATPIWKQREAYGLQGRYYTWSHRTMSSADAFELEQMLLAGAKHSVLLPGALTLSVFLMVDNGLTVSETQEVFRLYADLSGKNVASAELRARSDFRRVRQILLSREFPLPAGVAARAVPTQSGRSPLRTVD